MIIAQIDFSLIYLVHIKSEYIYFKNYESFVLKNNKFIIS